MATQRQIVAGPSKDDLKAALFEGKHVEFTLDDRTKIEVAMRSVGWEDGSRESWLISGYIIVLSTKKPPTPWQPFHGYYTTKRRTGWIEVTSSPARQAQEDEGFHMGPAIM